MPNCKFMKGNCHVCQQGPELLFEHSSILQALDSRNEKLGCKFKTEGCSKTLVFEERKQHEEQCEFRPIFCPHYDCQPQRNQFVLASIADHYFFAHRGAIRFQVMSKKWSRDWKCENHFFIAESTNTKPECIQSET